MNALERNIVERNIPAPNIRPDCTDELTVTLGQRIMVIDGAMGTAIQRDRPDEAGYRGERFMPLFNRASNLRKLWRRSCIGARVRAGDTCVGLGNEFLGACLEWRVAYLGL